MIRPTFSVLLLCLAFFPHAARCGDDTVSVKRVKIFPFPAIGYAPETRWYFGAVGLFQLRLSDRPADKTSQVELEFNYTQNKQFIYSENHELRFGDGRFLFTGENGFYRYPETDWQESFDGEVKVHYDADRIEIDNAFTTRVKNLPFLGIRFRYHYMKVLSSDHSPVYYPGKVFRGNGLGPVFIIDSRDNPLNATKGFYANGSLLFASGVGAYADPATFLRFDGDFRTYFSYRNKSVLALQLVVQGSIGDNVPIRMYSLMGGEEIMRGYYTGRHRNNYLAATQTEYRFRVWNWLGAAAFMGYGAVFGSHDASVLRYSYGGGIRIRLDKNDNINLRFDYGAGYQSDGFYVSFGEAF